MDMELLEGPTLYNQQCVLSLYKPSGQATALPKQLIDVPAPRIHSCTLMQWMSCHRLSWRSMPHYTVEFAWCGQRRKRGMPRRANVGHATEKASEVEQY